MTYEEALGYLKQIPNLKITLSGDIGSGKSTFSKRLSATLGIDRIYIGQLMREEAQRRGMTLDDFNELLKIDKTIDQEIDLAQRKKAEGYKKVIFEGRTSWYFVENADLKIFLKVNPDIAAQRVWGDNDNHLRDTYSSIEQIVEANKARKENEIARYKALYNINIADERNFDLIIDTSNTGIEETFRDSLVSIAQFMKQKQDLTNISE
ncbi:hypothetical protein COY25_01245 [Candidatus Uhrbacteria bacterium CG_4_10_14_0_2_um_filter_41_7]|uniref:(d)CMP kinase n=1 Tax=Candidatus Uhrbacteria bacterium CG_4_9_14_3_um_filter_41_35 TaxID=1975034 RepID=A0A2M7XGE8_9BACT|nr:MAG: hypothetical protein COV92_00185 [Candidatus Uhrbacteria bacterium CG11_big_fil_rev_8_21_14_0_20_41_9]PIZ55138.1 MAG: hypothetical protein COY25_01245 [Candidatus Uhrbacteria bacterium CG_4_10_14_0_2_um_filter_41_7]PJA46925.1 MAG: hypothetical protein CO173_00865 [Candidatus Uhrbacteria bacterium CG_4_9_14_3_um_filter_41_35]